MPKLSLKAKSDLLRKKLLRPTIKALTQKHTQFVSSGSWIINLAITGNVDFGYPVGRVINIIGDYSTGKTLLACELCNAIWYHYHLKLGKKIKIYYDEPEASFDYDLAIKFNMPLQHIYGLREGLSGFKLEKGDLPFKRSKKIEDLYGNITKITETESKKYDMILYVTDSLDSLQDAREIQHIKKKGIEKQDHGGGKARVLSQMFRDTIQAVNESNVILLILSQVRSNYGVIYGPKYTRAGGKALDHYSSIIMWLYETDKILAKNGFLKGIQVDIELTKNKVGAQKYYKTPLSIIHGYGIDNYASAINFLWDKDGIEKSGSYAVWNEKKYYREPLIEMIANGSDEDKNQLKQMLQTHWDKMVKEATTERQPKWS